MVGVLRSYSKYRIVFRLPDDNEVSHFAASHTACGVVRYVRTRSHFVWPDVKSQMRTRCVRNMTFKVTPLRVKTAGSVDFL